MKRKRIMTIFSLSLLVFLDTLTVGLVIPLLAVMFSDGHNYFSLFSSSQSMLWYSLTVSLPIAMILFGAPFLGGLSDKFGRKKIILFSLLGICVSTLLSIYSLNQGSLILFFVSRLLVGFFDSNQAIAQAAIADISGDSKERVQNMTIVTLMATLGLIFGPVLGGIFSDPNIVSWFNLRTPFWFSMGLALLSLVWLFFSFSETKKNNIKKKTTWSHNFIDLLKLIFNKKMFWLMLSLLALQLSWAVIFQLTNLYLAKNYGYSSSNLGYFSAYITLIFSMFIVITTTLLLKILAQSRILKLGYIIFTLGALSLVLLSKYELGIWITLTFIAIGMGLTYNIFLSLISESATNAMQGRIMGVATAVVAIAWLLGALYISLISIITTFNVFIGTALISLLGLLIILPYNAATSSVQSLKSSS